ncbi:MAG TPA: MFS transporter [Anaerolineales bacterium]|nr:MFS transporter [Anaerolineales bacterium]
MAYETNIGITPVGYLSLVRRNSNYRSLWIGEIISLFGDWFNLIASAALISSLTSSGLAVGGLFVVRMLAPFIVSPLAGVFADRLNRKRLLIVSDLTRAAIVLGFLLIRDPRHVWLLYSLTAVQLAISGFFYPARNAILPEIVSRNELGAANALSSATWSVMLALGAALGGLVAGQWGIYPAFVIDSLSFLLSAFFISRIIYHPASKTTDQGRSLRNAFTQYWEGLRYLRQNAGILAISLHKAALALTVNGAFQVIQVALAEQKFVIGEGGGTSLGMLYAISGVGTGLGPIFARHFTGDRERSLQTVLAISYGITILGLIIILPLQNFGTVLFGSFLRAFGTGINWVFSTQLLLQLLPDRIRGRVFSSEFALFTLANALGASAGGWAFDNTSLDISQIVGIMTVLTIIPGVLWSLWIFVHQRSTTLSG